MEQKQKIIGAAAGQAAAACNKQAKQATGWQRWLWGLGAAIAAAVAWFCSGGQQVQPAVEQQVETTSAES